MKSKLIQRSGMTALSLTMVALPSVSYAQDAPAAAAAEAVPVGVEDIVVTARKREESLQDVPATITAVSGDNLIERGITNMANLGAAVPGLRPSPHPSAPSIVQFSMRGQSAGDTLLTVDQAVGVYLDGIYIARPRGLAAAFFDLERVEAVKGPQGTLYGRNTTGGAVNLHTRGADFDGIHGFVGLDVGQYNFWSPRVAVNLPIVEDVLAVRLAYQGTFRDGFGESAITGQHLGQDRNQHLFRGSVLFEPADNVRVQLRGELYRSRENNTLWTPTWFSPTGGGAIQAAVELGGGPFLGPSSFTDPTFVAAYLQALGQLGAITAAGNADPFTNFTQIPQQDDNDIVTLSGRLEWDVSDTVRLTSLTGWRRLESDQAFDLEGTPFQIIEVGFGDGGLPIASGTPGGLSANFSFPRPLEQEDTFFSQELNLGGEALGGRLQWLVGGYYSRERGRDVQVARVLPALTGIVFANDGYRIRNDSWSLFTQNDFQITDMLSITAGVRYTKEIKSLTSRLANFIPANGLFICGSGAVNPGGTPVTTTDVTRAPCEFSNGRSFTGWSWMGSLNFEPTDNILLFAKVARGFRGGAFQLRAPTAPPAGPETATEYELGFKGDFFDRRLRFNISYFHTVYANKQESIIVALPAGNLATILQNAADATIDGFEAELTAQPFTGLTIAANVAYLTGRYQNFVGALPIFGGAPVDASGERFANPPWSFNISGRYEHQVGPGVLGIQADYSWVDGARPPARLINPNIPVSIIDSTIAQGGNGRDSLGLVNGRIDYRINNVTLSVWGTNLTNHRYRFAGIDPSSTGTFATIPGAPRMIAATVRIGFGGE